MRTLLMIFIFAVALPVTALSQKPRTSQLTLEQLISLYNSDPNDINDFLSARGWEYNGAVPLKRDADGVPQNFGKLTWAFGYNDFQETAEAWFTPFLASNDEIVVGNYQCKKAHFEAIKNRAISIGMKKLWSSVGEDGNLVSAYRGAKYTLRFIVIANGGYRIQISGGEGSFYRTAADADQMLQGW